MRLLLTLVLLISQLAWAAEQTDYPLFPGDLVRIQVLNEPELSLELRVPVSGGSPYPLVGPLTQLAGRPASAVSEELRSRLADGYLRQPVVTVTIAEHAPRSAWVVGAVTKPGAIALDPLRPSTAMQALGEAGGLAEDADRANARILRETGDGAKIALSLPAELLPTQDVVLQHGDVLVVPRRDRVFVLGQVERPGAVPLPSRESLTVSRALALAGGFSRFAREGRVHLLRPGEQPVQVDVQAVLDGDKGAVDPVLHAGDTVFVPESRF